MKWRASRGAWRRAAIGLAAACLAASPASAQSRGNVPSPASAAQEVVGKYCVTCHSAKLKTGNLVLEGQDVSRVAENSAIWEKVVKKLGAGVMPPAGAPRPDRQTQDAVLAWLKASLDRAAAAAPNPGEHVPQRLNRAEYANAIRDLLGFEIDSASLLPADASGYGFDNIADVLSMSPTLLDRYLLAAQKISRMAVGDPKIKPYTVRYQLPMHNPLMAGSADDKLPFGSRGGAAIKYFFPVDGEYVIKLALQRGRGYQVRGTNVVNQLDVRLDGRLLKRFSIGGPGRGRDIYEDGGYDEALRTVRLFVPAGEHLVGASFVETVWSAEGVGPARLPAGSVGFSAAASATDPIFGRIEMGVDTLEIEGPFNGATPADSPSRKRIFVCRPAAPANEEPPASANAPARSRRSSPGIEASEDGCARRILEAFARRAFRGPVRSSDLTMLLDLYRLGRKEDGFEAGVQWGLEAILTHPNFLFRAEAAPAPAVPGTLYRISTIELASRLSFFLWSTIPDEELLDVAIRGRLSDPGVLEQQVRRMLRDERARALVDNFFGQWLLLRNMDVVTPDAGAYPDFDDTLRVALKQETTLFLRDQLQQDRGVLELLTANYTFLNERLARHYGVSNVYGSHFRRVTYPDDRRAGLLGHGSLLTVTSYANRTSPVLRGKFLLENVLGTPPPPPPANVPPLDESQSVAKVRTMRERMEQHRKNPVCAACHRQLDPLGFALENFDGIGAWRSRDAGAAIDVSGAFPDGAKFDGVTTFRRALAARRDAFLETVTERLLTYALGRGVQHYDQAAIRQILREAGTHEYRWSSLIVNVVRSLPFQMRRARS